MITELEYVVRRGGVPFALRADKDVKTRNAWHLASVEGNGLPPVSAMGTESHGVAGQSYEGVSVGAREVEATMYADGADPAGCQALLSEASRVFSAGHDALGALRLKNAAGEWFRIPAKCLELEADEHRRRTALCSAVFFCPYAWFESDTLFSKPLFAVEGGKEYPLERPYDFGGFSSAGLEQTVDVFNPGDVAAPIALHLFGAGLSSVEVVNETTGAEIIVSGMTSAGLELSTDENDLYAVLADGSDASAYVSLFSRLSEFKLEPGNNVLTVRMAATSLTAAGTRIEWRGRYSACL